MIIQPPITQEQYDKAVSALKVCMQALCEIHHCRKSPDWFTDGESAAWQHTTLWIDRAAAVIKPILAENEERVQAGAK